MNVRSVGAAGGVSLDGETPESVRPARDRRVPPPRPLLAIVLIVLTSFVVLSSWVWRSGAYPNGAWANGSSDHYSHWSSAILVWHRGIEVYRTPLWKVCPEAPAHGVYALVARGDVCNVPERAGRRPLVTNWRQFPRPYPPGWALYHAPAAILHETTNISFHALNRLVIIQYLAAAHATIAVLAALLLVPRRHERLDGVTFAVRAFVVVLAGGELVRWSMLGYYDAIAVLFATLAVGAVAKRRDVDAFFWLSAAVFLHFRALWLLPIFPFVAARVVWHRQRIGEWSKLASALVMLLCAGVAFLLLRPSLAAFPRTNPVLHVVFDRHDPERWNLAVPLAVAFAVLIGRRAYLVAAVAAWQLYMVTRTPQVQPWHALSLLPLLVLARFSRTRAAEVAAAAIFLVECRQIFDVAPLPGAWMAALFQS